MALVCSFIISNNQHFTCQLNMSSMCPPAVALRSHSRRRCHSPTLLSMNDCRSFCHASTIIIIIIIIILFVSVRQLSRNFDDGRPSAEGHPRWHNQPGSNPRYSVVIYYVWLNELHVLTLPETRCVTTAIIRYMAPLYFPNLIQINYDLMLRMK